MADDDDRGGAADTRGGSRRNDKRDDRGVAVPGGRTARLMRFGTLVTSVAGGMMVDGVRQLAEGKRPRLSDLILTPANAMKLTQQLSRLRGAAMKLGQLVSMDAGDFVPPELANILAQLRSDARPMPQKQLDAVLQAAWGAGWEKRFARFDGQPFAAASIGQVHRATLKNGRELAIKVQYPGVRRSIDSDVDNVAALLRLSNMLPRTLDIAPLLAEAKVQLHQEADYAREARMLARYGVLLGGDPDFRVPALQRSLSGATTLAMDYCPGVPIEQLASASAAVRNAAATRLCDLTLRELFVFRLMQTDPNFANYLADPDSGRIILLDFGATRAIPADAAAGYGAMLRAALAGDRAALTDAGIALGLVAPHIVTRNAAAIDQLYDVLLPLVAQTAPIDFADRGPVTMMRETMLDIAADRANWHLPPADSLFIQRKMGGMFLLASTLRAHVPVRELLLRYTA